MCVSARVCEYLSCLYTYADTLYGTRREAFKIFSLYPETFRRYFIIAPRHRSPNRTIVATNDHNDSIVVAVVVVVVQNELRRVAEQGEKSSRGEKKKSRVLSENHYRRSTVIAPSPYTGRGCAASG